MPPARVLVLEDDQAIGEALVVALNAEGYEVRWERDGASGQAQAEVFRADLAILDVRLPPGPSGLDVGRRLRELSAAPIMFLTAADAPDERLAGFALGADDYVVKPFLMAELLARVRALLRRSGRLVSQAWQLGELVVDEGGRTALVAGAPLDLTRTEFDLLVVLLRHRGQVLSKSQLLTMVWGYDAYEPNLVEVRLSSLRRKLEPRANGVITTVRGAGYRIGR